jgi:hypothetical protein
MNNLCGTAKVGMILRNLIHSESFIINNNIIV